MYKGGLDPTHDSFTLTISCSDEELEDNRALLYLPIAPEVEDPEENPFGPPPDASGQAANTDDALAGGDKKQRQPSSDGGPAKKKARTTTIELQGVPSDGEQTSTCLVSMLDLARWSPTAMFFKVIQYARSQCGC